MLQKYIPNEILSCISYAYKCDYAIMRKEFYKNNNYPLNFKFFDGCKIYCWTNAVKFLFDELEKLNVKDIILITGDDDHLTNPNGTTVYNDKLNNFYSVVKFLPKNVKKWYSQNAEVVNNTMIPIPVGLCPPWARGVSSKEELESMLIDTNRDKLIYVNFQNQTNVWKRPQIFNIVTNNLQSNCTVGNYTEDKNKMTTYYKDLQEHKYVLCPPGNSKESHRMWETLYMGGIPVVEDNPSNRYFASLFPILVVERWSDITKELLETKYDYFMNTEWKYNLLDCDNLFREYGLSNE